MALTNVKPLQLAVLAILDKADQYEWSVQGLGMLRHYIRGQGRLHIWDSKLRYPGASLIHNHSWDLRSTVVAGRLVNTRFQIDPVVGYKFKTQRLVTGYKTHMVSQVEDVLLLPDPREIYLPGDDYVQTAKVIHQTEADDVTVTLMERTEDVDGEADVFWPAGESWVTAKPRPATLVEIAETVVRAIAAIERELKK